MENRGVDSELISQLSQAPRKDYGDLLAKIMNFDSLIYEIEQSLKNYAFDPTTNQWIKKGKPLVNEKGLTALRSVISAHLNNVFILSNFDDDDVRVICLNLGEDLIDALMLSYIDWEIDKRHLSLIYMIITDNVYAMFKGSFKEGIRLLLRDVEKRETKIIQEKAKRNWLSFGGGE